MGNAFQAVKIADRVYWVGAIDWGLRNFHGYLTSRGTTYNAFLVMAEKVTLIDTVKAPFADEMMARIASVVDPSSIEYVVSNHAEMDHTGALPWVIDSVAPSRVFASDKGVQALESHFHWDQEIDVVKTDDRVDLGDATLRFVETRMLHWPDSMFAYLEQDGILFSNDAFGMHLATAERFADEIPQEIWRNEAAKYYANILLPFSGLVKNLIGKLPELNLDIKMIAPDHGPVFRNNPSQIIDMYRGWAEQRATNLAVVVYDSMWQSTALMARAVGDGLTSAGMQVKLMPLEGTHRSDVATEILEAGALVVGSPTMNNQIYPTIADIMTYLKGLKPKNLVGAAFGSYGWSGEATKHLVAQLEEMKITVADDALNVKYVPTDEDIEKCVALGRKVAEVATGRAG